MSTPSWTPRVFSDGAQKTMINKTSAQVSSPPYRLLAHYDILQIIDLAKQGSLLALHVLVSAPSLRRAEFLPVYCSFLHYSEPPDQSLLASKDGGARDAVDSAFYCMIGVSHVLDAMEDLPRDRDTARKLTPLIAAWTNIFRWMAYVLELYGADTALHPMADICIATIACALGWEEMTNQVIQTPGIVALTVSAWMRGELTPDLPTPVAAWCLGDILNGLPLSAAREVLTAAAPSTIAARLTCGLRIATRTLPAALPHTVAYLQLLGTLGLAEPQVREVLCAAGVIRTVTKALVRVSELDARRETSVETIPPIGLSLVISFIDAGVGVDAVRHCVRAGILAACLNFGPLIHSLPRDTASLLKALIGTILPRYILFRSVSEAVSQSLRTLKSTHPEGRFDDAQLQLSWDHLGELAEARATYNNMLESQVSRSRASCANCLVLGRKTSFKRCARCHSTFYCSIQCQKEAWDTRHKAECLKFSRHYLAPTLSSSDASFQKAVVAIDARRRVPALRILAAKQFPNILLCSLAIYLDYTKSVEPECSLLDLFVDDSERAQALQCEDTFHRASTIIRYKIQLGEYEEISLLPVASPWSEDEVGGDILEEGDELDIRDVLDDVAERVSHVVARSRTGSLNPLTSYDT
ncbi:hypothetical protein FA95DRAFT_562361 [Auriscalpium vulgare]|uniref:Uncharacterized protein n=1 Tax=Auriscalpium vulgare TaxID=40419 RepID=A0ACB8RF61_9AGAM|nr:hypothetical protein FA95DRAFT_562361 [Auriscalpium vulgare]